MLYAIAPTAVNKQPWQPSSSVIPQNSRSQKTSGSQRTYYIMSLVVKLNNVSL